jgi:hypothetical protein
MANNWITFVKSYAQQHHISYACALSQPECKDAYRAKHGVSKKVPQKVERERMGLEDINIKPPPPRRKPAQHSKEAFKMATEDIHSRLMRENVPYPPVKIKIPRISKKQPVVHYEDIYPEEAPIHHAPAPAKRGRKPKYATAEEKAIAKRQQTLASNLKKTRERASEKKEGKKMGKEDYRF